MSWRRHLTRWRAVWGILFLIVAALWAWSWRVEERAGYVTRAGAGFQARSGQGLLTVEWIDLDVPAPLTTGTGFQWGPRQPRYPQYGVFFIYDQDRRRDSRLNFQSTLLDIYGEKNRASFAGLNWTWMPRTGPRAAAAPIAQLSGLFRESAVALHVPYWMIETTIAAGVAAAWALAAWRRQGRSSDPAAIPCAACGYDLRAATGPCPECGATAARARAA